MDKTLYSASILIALVLMAGSAFFPNNAVMWLASTSVWMDIARTAIVLLMIGLLLTEPPRSLLFRALLGVGGILMATAAIIPVMQGSIHVLDVLLAAESSVAFFLAAIEAEPQETADDLPSWINVIPRSILIPLAMQYVRFTAAFARKLEESAPGLGGPSSAARRPNRLSPTWWTLPGPPP